jgi:hypothetical protein
LIKFVQGVIVLHPGSHTIKVCFAHDPSLKAKIIANVIAVRKKSTPPAKTQSVTIAITLLLTFQNKRARIFTTAKPTISSTFTTVAEDEEYDEKVSYDSSVDQMTKIFAVIQDEIKPSRTALHSKLEAKSQVIACPPITLHPSIPNSMKRIV